MLCELRLRDFALIDALTIEFGPGLNAITGETGSGKSLVVTALELLAGARPRGGVGAWVRAGAERAVLEAAFEPPAANTPAAARVEDWFERYLPELAHERWREEDLVHVARVLDGGGRSRARVLGSTVTLAALAELVALLLEVNGQFEQRAVLDGARQTAWFDEIASSDEVAAALARYADDRRTWIAARRERERVDDLARERDGRATFLRLALEELDGLEPRPGEGSELRRERELLRQSERVVSELGQTAAELSEDDGAIVARLGGIADRLARWSNAAEPLHACAEELSAGLLHLENAASGLVSFLSDVESDPRRLDHVETRLERLERAARRHGLVEPEDVDGLAAHAAALRGEADELEDLDATGERVRAEEARALERVGAAAVALTRARRAATPAFVAAVRPLLDRLGLAAAELVPGGLDGIDGRAGVSGELSASERAPEHADPSASGRFGPLGDHLVEFAWRPNPGEPARPLAHIASGGEAARVFLALRCAAAQGGARATADARRALVFDEVDAAVGGRLAPKVAACLAELAGGVQVLTVTHQPAIAARADRHLAVVKRVRDGRSVSRAVRLEGTARLSEVAAMIAGSGRSPAARAEAQRLLDVGDEAGRGETGRRGAPRGRSTRAPNSRPTRPATATTATTGATRRSA